MSTALADVQQTLGGMRALNELLAVIVAGKRGEWTNERLAELIVKMQSQLMELAEQEKVDE